MKKNFIYLFMYGSRFFLYAQESPAQTVAGAQAEVSVPEESSDLQEAHEKIPPIE